MTRIGDFSTMETGNAQIDEQHRELFRLVSDLVDACRWEDDAEMLDEALDFLAVCSARHFASEEALQKKFDYPDLPRHKKLHDNFRRALDELRAKYATTNAISLKELSEQVHAIAARWLGGHIAREDAKVAAHIRRKLADA
ncbi:MAG: hemerythrin family protein [Synergistaceae bacterium]|jgi:hemerythrin|nr:hemerythrin family protein [Synergistaceae bacterium]